MKKISIFILLLLPALAFAQTGIIHTIAGNGSVGFSGDGGPATAAGFNTPKGVAFDASGNMYIADYSNSAVRKISPAGIIRTIAGRGSYGFSGDGGPATAAYLDGAYDVAVDASGNVYIADYGNNVVRKINSSGVISTFAGNHAAGAGFSGDGGPATAAKLNRPTCVKLDAAGNLYIADGFNHRIRKVNTSGVITTIAGNGSASFSGDGGPATAAELNTPSSVAIDYMGNILIADKLNNRIRLVNSSGIINTIAGNGSSGTTGDGAPALYAQINPTWLTADNAGRIYFTDIATNRVRGITATGFISTISGGGAAGFSGDGGPATAAALSGPEVVTLDTGNRVYISDGGNGRVRALANADIFLHSSDSMDLDVDDQCDSLTISIVIKRYTAGMYVKTYYGDGTHDTSHIIPSSYGSYGIVYAGHHYSSSGYYTLKNVLYSGATPVDSVSYSFNHTHCPRYVSFMSYDDRNGNCSYDTTEWYIGQPLKVVIDSNGITIDSLSFVSMFSYDEKGNPGDIYQYHVSSAGLSGMVLTCPSTGIVYDTVVTGATTSAQRYFGFSCSSSATAFDLAIPGVAHFSGNPHFDSVTRAAGYFMVANSYCNAVSTTVQLKFTPRLTFNFGYPSPSSVTSGSVTWNFTGVCNTAPRYITYQLKQAGSSSLHAGDTVHSQIIVTPSGGDADTTNNEVAFIDTVSGSFDPNYISVSPAGHIISGTKLLYTISFENTGNDTAFNIHVMDTLSNDLDLGSCQVVAASHNMTTTKLKDAAGHNILKFDFPGINLLDSSHRGHCDGMVVYTINTKAGLPDCEHIYNRAGIYFDYNDVVMTNEVGSVIGCWAGIGNVEPVMGNPTVFPNPANDELNIQLDNGYFASLVITNSVGSTVISQPINKALTQINIKQLPSGLYYVTLKGEQGNVVRKFVKM